MVEGDRENGVRDELPRVSVESLQDWLRIRENFTTAAIASLDAKLAERGLENQRYLFLPHIKQFAERTFQIAKPNLRINGRNFDDYDEDEQDIDQFDEALDRRVWSLSDQRLKWDLEIALKRRGVPVEVETLMRDLIAQQREHDNKLQEGKGSEMEMDDEALNEHSNLPSVNSELCQFGAEVQQTLPEQLERVHRVRQVDAEIRNLRA